MSGIPARWAHTGAVLAGGRSRRMGSPKHAVRLSDGRMMIEHVAGALAVCCRRVVVVGRVRPLLPNLQYVNDRRPDQGPLGGIESLLASGMDTEYLLCPCDLPLVTAEVLEALTANSADRLMTVLRLEGEAEPRPLPARIDAAALPRVTALLDAGRRAVHELVRELDAEVVDAPAEWTALLRNVNTPEDVRRL